MAIAYEFRDEVWRRARQGAPVVAQLHKWNRAGDEAFYGGNWDRAEEHFLDVLQKVHALRERPSSVCFQYADAARNLASLALLRGDGAEAMDRLRQSARYFNKISAPERWLVEADHAICAAYAARQEGCLQQAFEILEAIEAPDPRLVPYVTVRRNLERANLARSLGCFEESAALLQTLRAHALSNPERPDASGALAMMVKHYLGVTWMEQALYLRDDRLVEPAEEALKAALALAQRGSNPSQNKLYVLRSEKALGWIALHRGDFVDAEAIALRTLAGAGRIGDVKTTILSRVLLGAAMSAMGRSADGMEALRQALRQSDEARYWHGQVAAWTFLGRDAARRGATRETLDAAAALRGLGRSLISPKISRVVEELHASLNLSSTPSDDDRLSALYAELDSLDGSEREANARLRGEIAALEERLALDEVVHAARETAQHARESRERMDAVVRQTLALRRSLGDEHDAYAAEDAVRVLRLAVASQS